MDIIMYMGCSIITPYCYELISLDYIYIIIPFVTIISESNITD